MYKDDLEVVYSNLTPRSSKYAPKGNNGMVLNFGQQYAVRFIVEHFDNNFFNLKKEDIVEDLKSNLSQYLGVEYDTKHIEDLHDLGYLPLQIRSLTEGTESAIKVPVLFLYNTNEKFAWLTNYVETIISNMLWQPLTSATNVLLMRRIVNQAVEATDIGNIGFTQFMLHDFSMRGLTGLDAAIGSGMAFMAVSKGSDNLPAIKAAQHYYDETGVISYSIRATEHSQMTAGGIEGEFQIFKDLIEKFPEGNMGLVSDSFDLWRVLTDYLPKLKVEIMSRKGTVVIRPDSGNPTDIICGNDNNGSYRDKSGFIKSKNNINESKGVIELLWDTFGGTINEQGYKVLDPHIGMIYGEAINQDNIKDIFARLEAKGFAATNCVFGQGSYSVQYVTRDTWGMAIKCIAQQRSGKLVEIFKDPITDDGMKKSAKGLTVVYKNAEGAYYLKDQASLEEVNSDENELKVIFQDGVFFNKTTITEIRNRLNFY
jgi:nicotinamide phosphoribosyltransferase